MLYLFSLNICYHDNEHKLYFKLNYPIDFCIGFTMEDSKYILKQMDKEPICFNINMNKIPITNKI
jgi:hypothetical protein